MDQVRDLALEHRPKMIVAGTTSYPRRLEPEPFRAIADEVGALFLFDAAHIAGLVAGGAQPDPVPFADVVTLTTHKTLRGPRGGTILCRAEHAKAIDKAVFPGWQGGPLEHVIAAKAIAFREAAHPSFKQYAHQIVANAAALAQALAGEGFRLVSGGTDNHLMVVDLQAFDGDLTGKVAQSTLDEAGITLNKNTVPNDPRSPFVTSGLRIGTPSVTTQGMTEAEMSTIAALIARALRERNSGEELSAVRKEVAELCARFPAYPDGDPPPDDAFPPDPTIAMSGSRRLRPSKLLGRSPKSPSAEHVRRRGRRTVGSGLVPVTGDYLIIGAVAAVVTFARDAARRVGSRTRSRLAVPPERAHGAHQADAGDRRPGDVHRVHRRVRRRPSARPLRPAVRPQLRAARHHRGGRRHRRRRPVRRRHGLDRRRPR